MSKLFNLDIEQITLDQDLMAQLRDLVKQGENLVKKDAIERGYTLGAIQYTELLNVPYKLGSFGNRIASVIIFESILTQIRVENIKLSAR